MDDILDAIPRIKRNREIRVWCAASSSGQEPVSIAITLQELLGDNIDIPNSDGYGKRWCTRIAQYERGRGLYNCTRRKKQHRIGMPKEAISLEGANKIVPLDNIADVLKINLK